MLETERTTIKQNSEVLANLLTENVPYLLGHYLKNGVLTEEEREDIISAGSSHEIRVKLVETVANKQDVPLESIIEGLNATENQCVSKEIESLITGNPGWSTGAGDREEMTSYATNLVNEVIQQAEQTTSHQSDDYDKHEENEAVDILDKLVEANVEVHRPEVDVSEEEDNQTEDSLDKSISLPETVASVVEDTMEDEEPTPQYESHGMDAESENDDDQIDIEKEFTMPTEDVHNGKDDESKPFSQDDHSDDPVILETNKKPEFENGDNELDSVMMARKALVRQQVEKFEQPQPGGKVRFSLKSTTNSQESAKNEEAGSNVKNLKNFFQRLSTSETTASGTAPLKPVGKLKVTFPAS